MLTSARDRAPWIVTLVGLLLLAAALLVVGGDETVGAQEGRLTLNPEEAGFVCFSIGEKKAVNNIGFSYDITNETIGLATLRGYGGPGVMVRNVKLNATWDKVAVYLTKPATRAVCASFYVKEATTLG